MQDWKDAPRRSEPVDISSADHTFTLAINAIHNASATGGQVAARLVGDSADSLYYLPAGATQPGYFTIVRKVGTAITATGCLCGLTPQSTDGG